MKLPGLSGRRREEMVLNNRFGAFIDPELEVPGLARGKLNGLSFAVKDVFAVSGHRSSAGNPHWLRSHAPSSAHAAAVWTLLQSGASLRGAAHTDELMYEAWAGRIIITAHRSTRVRRDVFPEAPPAARRWP